MKQKLPEYLLCEDPTTEKENLFIYHVLTRSLVHVIHNDAMAIPDNAAKYTNRKHFDYTYKNNLGREQKIMFVAEIVDSGTGIEQSVLQDCAHWYACYLGWEEECDDFKKQLI